MPVPAAYVLPLDDRPQDASTNAGYRQPLDDAFAVVVAFANVDRRGQQALDAVRLLRKELWRALLGWEPDDDHGPIVYEAGQLVDFNRALLWYRFDFSAPTEITQPETRLGADMDELPTVETVSVQLDAIDPFDPNRIQTGPDGRNEVQADLTIPQ